MNHDVFVSYSSKDKGVADFVVASLEGEGIRCWYAPRDIPPGGDWGNEIVAAINEASVFLLIFSGNANKSHRVLDELNLAISKEIVVLPFRIENLDPVGAMQLHLSTRHWLDAFQPSWKQYTEKLTETISAVLSGNTETLASLPSQGDREVAKRIKTRKGGWTRWLVPVVIVILLGLAAFIFGPKLWDSLMTSILPPVATTETLQIIETDEPVTPSPAVAALGSEENPIVMMYVPLEDAEFTEIDAASEEIVQSFAQENPGLRMKLLPTYNMESIKDALCNGDAQIGILDAFTYLDLSQEGCPAEARLVWSAYEDIKWGGEFLAWASNPSIQSISDLGGKVLCIPDRSSISAWVLPSLEIKAVLGDPEMVLGGIFETGSHNDVVNALYNGECDAGVAYYDVRESMVSEIPNIMENLVIIEKTTFVPQANITIANELDSTTIDKLESFFISLSMENPNLAKISGFLDETVTQKLVEVNDYYYTDLRDLFRRAGEDPSNY